jgi:hypothetical protein
MIAPRAAIGRFPIGRIGELRDVVAGAVFDASNEAELGTGTTLLIDGGRKQPVVRRFIRRCRQPLLGVRWGSVDPTERQNGPLTRATSLSAPRVLRVVLRAFPVTVAIRAGQFVP